MAMFCKTTQLQTALSIYLCIYVLFQIEGKNNMAY